MTTFNYRLPTAHAVALIDSLDAGTFDIMSSIANVVPTDSGTETTLKLVAVAAAASLSDTFIVSLITDENNPIMEPYVANIAEAFEDLDNLFFRYVAL